MDCRLSPQTNSYSNNQALESCREVARAAGARARAAAAKAAAARAAAARARAAAARARAAAAKAVTVGICSS